jgi:hypothetical protein
VCADVQPFPEKIALAQYAQGRFLLRYDRKSNLTFPVIQHFVSRVSLREGRLLIGRSNGFSALAQGGEKLLESKSRLTDWI